MADEAFPSRAAIQAEQLAHLRTLLGAVLSSNSFYQRKLAESGFCGDIISLEEFSARCPFTRKHELADDQRAHPLYGTNLTFPHHRYTRFHQTSGTSGAPMRWLDDPASWKWMMGNWERIYEAASVTANDRILFAFSFGPFIGFWLAFEAAEKLGCLCLPGGGLSSVARLHVLLDNEATILCCTPTYAVRLAEVATKEQIDLRASGLRKIIVAGEAGGSVIATRQRIENLWPGVRVFDHHGMTEVGPVSYECPAQPGVLHVIETAYFAEIIDSESGGRVAPGSVGELVLTTLGRIGSPVLRYRTGDLVKAPAWTGTQPCRCGRHDLALEGGILGRVDDMLVVRGVNVYPSAVEDILRACAEVTEYRVHVGMRGALTELRVEIEPKPDCTHAQAVAERLEKSLLTAFNLRVPVSLAPVGTLPRFEMKAQRWVKEGSREQR